MSPKSKTVGLSVVALSLLGLMGWLLYWLTSAIWHQFLSIDANLRASLLTASTTIIVAATTIVVGRYYERKKEVETHFRVKKTEIYDAFLKEFFKLFHGGSSGDAEQVDLVSFLKEWQRQMILWGGAGSLVAFMKWNKHNQTSVPNAQSLYLTDEFFRALRADLGLSNRGLEKGAFVRMLLKHPDLFFSQSRLDPKITLEELAKVEKSLGLVE